MTFYRLSGAAFYDHINTTYQFVKPFLDEKMSVFQEYGASGNKNRQPHYENTPIQIYRKFHLQKLKNFR